MIDKDFAKYLRPEAAAPDQSVFTRWATGHITLDSCIRGWLKNNKIEDTDVDELAFIQWLGSLGYYQFK